MAQLRIDFQGRGKAQTCSLVRVQMMGHGVQFALCSPTNLSPWGGTDATAHSCFHWWCYAATGCTDRQRRSGWQAVLPGARARPSLCPDQDFTLHLQEMQSEKKKQNETTR